MMDVLAIDTATRDGSVALARDGVVVAARKGDGSRPHATRLPGDALGLLAECGVALEDVAGFAVCLGPGAFTGLRVGIAAVQGLAFATGKPVAGVSALDALAVAALDGQIEGTTAGIWMDAARREVFAARYRRVGDAPSGVRAIDEAVSAPPALVAASWAGAGPAPSRWIGDGTVGYRELIATGAIVEPVPLLAPLVARLGSLAIASGLAGEPHALRPIYVRPPDAVLAKSRR